MVFLKKDMKTAYALKGQAFELSMQYADALYDNDFYAAEQCLIKALELTHKLKKLKENKKVQDRFEGLVGHMQAQGIDAVVVRRLTNENR